MAKTMTIREYYEGYDLVVKVKEHFVYKPPSENVSCLHCASQKVWRHMDLVQHSLDGKEDLHTAVYLCEDCYQASKLVFIDDAK